MSNSIHITSFTMSKFEWRFSMLSLCRCYSFDVNFFEVDVPVVDVSYFPQFHDLSSLSEIDFVCFLSINLTLLACLLMLQNHLPLLRFLLHIITPLEKIDQIIFQTKTRLEGVHVFVCVSFQGIQGHPPCLNSELKMIIQKSWVSFWASVFVYFFENFLRLKKCDKLKSSKQPWLTKKYVDLFVFGWQNNEYKMRSLMCKYFNVFVSQSITCLDCCVL